jgi:uncharacterized protein with HEPN domain
MQPEARKYPHDVLEACSRPLEFTIGKTFEEYRADPMLRAAVERQFEIIGEALNRLSRLDRQVAQRITNHRRIIGFRNILVHGYAVVDDRVVWGVVEQNVDRLTSEVRSLLEE